ncbi:unnamed protein product [Ilex paraguariensis]|uniref:Homoserine dehydrogenase n=1 Tax=Ilex paraguariensis TaxID=185542 RepID=A0ABC8UUA5_9AQUA
MQQGVRLRVVGVCDSKSLLVALDVFTMELDDTFLMEVCRVKLNGSSLLTLSNVDGPFPMNYLLSPLMSDSLAELPRSISYRECQIFSNPESMRKLADIAALLVRSTGLAFVDCSASSETIGVLSRVVDMGCCVVLANKKPLTSSMAPESFCQNSVFSMSSFAIQGPEDTRTEDYDKLVSQPRRIRHECTVGAGLPVIASLNRMLSCGDPIHRIIGSLSGTLGYVMSEVEDGKPFSQVVKSAKSLGYTEPDPRDDLSGMDVARKALILARLLGRRINLDSIKIESLYPVEMGPNFMSVEDFLLNGLPSIDKDIQQMVEKASSNGNVLRYVCVIEDSRCEVGIQELQKDSPLGRLRGSDNVILGMISVGWMWQERNENNYSLCCHSGLSRDTMIMGLVVDPANKALILARLLGRRINLDSIKIESLYPVEMGPNFMSVEDFLLNGLPSIDKDIQQMVEKASSNGNVLRYVCVIEDSRCEVGIQELQKDSPLGRLRGSDNVVTVSALFCWCTRIFVVLLNIKSCL